MGITNQRETTVLWDKKTGKPIANAIVWQCRRTADFCQSLSSETELIRLKTGLPLDAYFSASKIRWLLDHCADSHSILDFPDEFSLRIPRRVCVTKPLDSRLSAVHFGCKCSENSALPSWAHISRLLQFGLDCDSREPLVKIIAQAADVRSARGQAM